jgi:UDP-4-amino-4-deoxy-L-arabinose-oxoglutarate aminotransferase
VTAILHSKPWLTEDDFRAVREVLCSGWLAQGENTAAFERALAEWVCVDNPGVGVGSGSAAIVLALKALGVTSSDEVILPTYVCESVLDAAVAVGAAPVLCDVGLEWVATVDEIEPRVTSRCKALIVPHMYGIFADVQSIRALGVPIVEDCAQALDDFRTRPVQGDIAIYSFHPTKCLTTGEGGMAVAGDQDLAAMMRELRDGRATWGGRYLFSPLSDVASALGLSQLSRYTQGLLMRQEFAGEYKKGLESYIRPYIPDLSRDRTMWFRFPLLVPGGLDGCGEAFASRGIYVRRGVNRLLHRLLGLPDERFPNAVRLFQQTVSLPIYPALSRQEHGRALDAAQEIFSSIGNRNHAA